MLLRKTTILFALLALSLAFGCAPTQFKSPQLHSALCDKNCFTEQELKSSSNKVSINTTGKALVNSYGHWSDDALEMTWFDDNKLGFMRQAGKNRAEKEYFVYDLTAQEAYPTEDEFLISKINEKHHSTEIRMSNVSDKDKSLGGQIFSALLSAASCADETRTFQSKISNSNGDVLYDFYRYDKMKGRKVKGLLGYTCSYSLESRSCRMKIAGIDGGGKAVPCLNDDTYGFITEDETLFVNGNYVMDLRNFEVFPGALVDVDSSKPPVLVKYTISPALDKMALLFADTNDYLVEIVDIDLDEMARAISAGGTYTPADPSKPRYVFSNMNNRPNMFSIVEGDLYVYNDRFEFVSAKQTQTLRFNEITKIKKTLMSDHVVIKGQTVSFEFHERDLASNGLMSREDAVSKFKRLSSI